MLCSLDAGEKFSIFGKISYADIVFRTKGHKSRGERFEPEAHDILDRMHRRLKNFFLIYFNNECFPLFVYISIVGGDVERV